MAQFLLQVAYTPEAWAKLIAHPENRIETLNPLLQKLGGKFVQGWFCFGEYDLIGVIEMPDNTGAAAFSLAASAGGAVKAIKTTPLMSMEEGLDAMKKAGTLGYRPPQ
jgi:uncharacterized protein with GYD domain